MYEELFLNLLKQYKDGDLSLSRVITDSRFKSMPLEEKVRLLKDHGHTIHAGSKIDNTFWKDFGAGMVGTAVMLAEPAAAALMDLKKGYVYAEKHKQSIADGTVFNEPTPVPELNAYKSFAIAATGAGIAAPKFYQALQARNNMKMVKRLLNDQPGSNTQENAINVIARS